MKKKKQTEFIHNGYKRSSIQETSLPLYLTSGYVYPSAEEAELVFDEKIHRYQYSRFDNPTVNQFEKKFALLEGAESCKAFSSGMSAVFASFMCQVKKEIELLVKRFVLSNKKKILRDLTKENE